MWSQISNIIDLDELLIGYHTPQGHINIPEIDNLTEITLPCFIEHFQTRMKPAAVSLDGQRNL